MRFVPVCSVEADVVFHYPFEEAHTGTHKTVFKPKTCMFIHTDAQQHVPPFPAGGPARGPHQAIACSRIPGEAHPVVRHLSGEGQIAFITYCREGSTCPRVSNT